MKKLFIIFATALLTVNVFAQSPEKMSYQAIIRNNNNALVAKTQIGMQISILQGSANGTSVYTETQTPSTNTNGLVSIEIGAGAVQSGVFASIDWANGPYFIKTETDPTGETNYTIVGIVNILSVPYALHAKTAERLTGTVIEADPTFTIWNKSTGISITENQISNLGTYIKIETDPLFTASPASGITNSTISNWTNAFGWGNHASAGYLTSFTETDPTFTSNFNFTGTNTGDLLQYNGSKWVNITPNYISSYSVTQNDVTTHQSALQLNKNQITDLPTNATTTSDGFMSSADKTKLDTLQNANGSETKIVAGNNISVTGAGTTANPYVINANNNASANVSSVASAHYVGELYGGGVVFWVDHTGEHGLICSMVNISTAQKWSNVTTTLIGITAQSDWDGQGNTNAILSQAGHSNSAAIMCDDYSNDDYGTGIYSDWYLPSIAELNHVWNNFYEVQKAISNDGNALTTPLVKLEYWSSTEGNNGGAWNFYFYYGRTNNINKASTAYVRAVRAF